LLGVATVVVASFGCSANPPPPDCRGEGWAYYQDRVDGVARAARVCVTGTVTMFGSTTRPPWDGERWLWIRFGVASAEGNSPPFCGGALLSFSNVVLRTGLSGNVTSGPDWNVRSSEPVVQASITVAGAGATCPAGDQFGRVTGGTWHVIQGGTWDEVVEVEARDVTVAPVAGHSLRIVRMRFRMRLPSMPVGGGGADAGAFWDTGSDGAD
jgi:hypothetical protein